jgi:hypothetical protein
MAADPKAARSRPAAVAPSALGGDAGHTPKPSPCPLCGGLATLQPMPSAPTWFRVQCAAWLCGCTTWAMGSETKAVAAWQKRAGGGYGQA